MLSVLHIYKADIIGFSDGAYTGYQFAAYYPKQTNKLVAIGAGEWAKGFVQGGRKDRDIPYKAMCRVLRVARSGWYAWCLRRQQITPRQQFRLVCDTAVRQSFTEAK